MEKQAKKNYALPIAMMFALFFMIAFVTGLQNPFGVIVKSQFHASNLLSQLGNFANFFAYACMGIPAGIMLEKLGYKKTSLAAIAVGFVGVGITYLSGISGSFAVYLIGALVSGFSMCMLNVVVNPMLNTLGGSGNKGNQLIQFGGACNSIGATIVPVLVGYLMGSDETARTIAKANPALFLAMGIFALAFIVLAVMDIPEPNITKSNTNNGEKDQYSPFSFRHYILGVIAIFIYVGIEVGIPNIANLFMTKEAGIDTTAAGFVVGTYWFLMLIGRLCGGMIGAKISSRTMLSIVSAALIVLVISAIFTPTTVQINMPVFQSNISFGMAQVPLCIMLLVIGGFCTSVMWGSIYNLAVEGLGKYTAKASGFFMVMVCGGGVLPAIQGYIADISTYMQSFWVIAIGLAYILFYALIGSKNVNTSIKTN
ncbi:MAG: MFS transporter [Bacteroidales bacterium]|jgi:FHS family L-fucose permease-like MFS transporter|nr:MFS transporter [Bacteroidales bacterium]